jgi:predicted RNA-binding Zn-ribbon protein involved in translation (DUF1610 family)
MNMETKDQFLERMLAADKPVCPHCGVEMEIWEVPPVNFGDGLGWGAPYLFVCFNDECSLYLEGWKSVEENYGQSASYRCMCYLGAEDKYECMPVFSPTGAKGQVIDNQTMMQEEMLKEATMRGFSILADCYVQKNGPEVLRILFDTAEPPKVRLKAAEMIGDIGEPDAVSLLRGAAFKEPVIQKRVDASIQTIHEHHFTRECPHCGEIVKRRAKMCKSCKQEIAGT